MIYETKKPGYLMYVLKYNEQVTNSDDNILPKMVADIKSPPHPRLQLSLS